MMSIPPALCAVIFGSIGTAPLLQGCEDPPANASSPVRIINGQDAGKCKWKWQAHIKAMVDSSSWAECGGSLIESKWVVSAAHCLAPGATSVRLGAYDITNPSPNEVEVNVIGKYMHATYDISLLELEREVESTDCISPVSLPSASVENSPHDNCYVTGWGYEDPDGQKQVTILQEGKMSLQSSDSFCEADQVCFAGSNSASVCHGDSGGPLVCQDDKWVLHGIVSNGHPGCMGVGAYARPFLALDWISKCKSGSNELWTQEEWQNRWKDFDGGKYSKC